MLSNFYKNNQKKGISSTVPILFNMDYFFKKIVYYRACATKKNL